MLSRFVLAALLFMRRMSELTESRLRLDSSRSDRFVPKGALSRSTVHVLWG
jgi:hypothetical protein